jgi:AIPR protein
MLSVDFYSILDRELEGIINRYSGDAHIQKNKGSLPNQKSYALLIWFLQFYGKTNDYVDYITDGPDDSSCDIVFDKFDNQGKRKFYIVQSKWNNAGNVATEIDKKDILQALHDFDTILRGNKQNVNDRLKAKLLDLQEHIRANGDVTFIYFSLCNWNHKADENVTSFLESNRRTGLEIYDLERIKIDFIERRFKKIDPISPLDSYYDPREAIVQIEINKPTQGTGNIIRIDKPFEAYVFLIKPRTIFELFEKYGFALFFRNVRNPLITSHSNREIEQTAIDNPAYFWYYNNGITAISSLLPEVRDEATTIEVTGLQVINGAQTVYSIYKAYKEASTASRAVMDSQAQITLRLLKSGGKDFDLKVTRFTNSQNPVSDQDFCANDDVQVRLQNESFATKFWYVKRRDEFREVPAGISSITNDEFASAYLAFHLQLPSKVIFAILHLAESGKNLLFISHRDHKDGLYETIFDQNARFQDFLSAYRILELRKKQVGDEHNPSSGIYHELALLKCLIDRFLVFKNGDNVNKSRQLHLLLEGDHEVLLAKFVEFVHDFLSNESHEFGGGQLPDQFEKLISETVFERIKGKFEALAFDFDAMLA